MDAKPFFFISIVGLAVILSACSQNLQGKAAEAAPYCPPSLDEGYCGDRACNGCETCQSCWEDCCPNACEETDGGNNLLEKGVITGIYRGETFRYEDVCQNPEFLMEYYCGTKDQNIPTNKRSSCSQLGKFTCENAVCVEKAG